MHNIDAKRTNSVTCITSFLHLGSTLTMQNEEKNEINYDIISKRVVTHHGVIYSKIQVNDSGPILIAYTSESSQKHTLFQRL